MNTLVILTLVCGVLSLLCLTTLHFVSSEFKPNWRMISEYALGNHKWLITLFFLFWGLSSVMLSIVLWNDALSFWTKLGVILLLISAIGEISGGLFDVKHKLHGLSFLLGVPTLPIGALLVSYQLIKMEAWKNHESIILFTAHSTWISFIVMAITMGMMMSGFKKAGIPMGPNVEPPKDLPAGVIGINGYANRILVLTYIGWMMVVSFIYLSI